MKWNEIMLNLNEIYINIQIQEIMISFLTVTLFHGYHYSLVPFSFNIIYLKQDMEKTMKYKINL